MRRHPRSVPFARVYLPRLVRILNDKLTKWPQHLRLAYELLHNELKLPDQTARRLLIDSVAYARTCARAADQRARIRAEHKLRLKVRGSFARLAKCVTRAPAIVRKSLDKRVSGLIGPNADTEMIDEILDAAHATFAQYRKHEFARTGLRALSVMKSTGKRPAHHARPAKERYCRAPTDHRPGRKWTVVLKAEYSGLGPSSRRSCERALSSLARTAASTTALGVFSALMFAIDKDPPEHTRGDISDLIVTYVAAVAALGLRPSRATHRNNPRYRSRFHRFVELVLTSIMEPFSNRHSDNIDQIAQATWKAHSQLPPAIRSEVTARLRRVDVEWLVSEDHVRKVLALPAQKNGRKTP
jgi:hypothetical protein